MQGGGRALFQWDVFLSYSSADVEVVRNIAKRLRKDGLRVWFDEWEIAAPAHIFSAIEAGLVASRVLILCMSASALKSEWSQLEADTFRFRDPLNRERRFVPLRLDDTEIGGSLAQFRWIDWRPGSRDYRKLLDACLPPLNELPESAAPASTAPAAIEPARAVPPTKPTRSTHPTKRIPHVEEPLRPARQHMQLNPAPFWSYAFTRDGRRVLTGTDDGHVRLWDLGTGQLLADLTGHAGPVNSVCISDDQKLALSGSSDGTLRVWDLAQKATVWTLAGHLDAVRTVDWNADNTRAISGSADGTARLWDLATGRQLKVMAPHHGPVRSVSWGGDGRHILTGAEDAKIRKWDLVTGHCVQVFEGHSDFVYAVPWRDEQQQFMSGSVDRTIRLWDVPSHTCLKVLEGHRDVVRCLAWSPDEQYALSGSLDRTVRLWDLRSGMCLGSLEGHLGEVRAVGWNRDGRHAYSGDKQGRIWRWDLAELGLIPSVALGPVAPEGIAPAAAQALVALPVQQIQYTNAKVVLVGESGAGKTALAQRLANDTFIPSYSTAGAWATQWRMDDLPPDPNLDRDVWLWDFGGQADQRLIHQLYLDNAALILLVFNADDDDAVTHLHEWEQALAGSIAKHTRTILVAGRVDGGLHFDRAAVKEFARQHHYGYVETSAIDGRGCDKLRKAIQDSIPWNELERRTSPTIWNLVRNEILRLREEGSILFTFKELREELRDRLAGQVRFEDDDLDTVIKLLDAPNIVKELGFGSYVLLRPEWLNAYAQAVIRTIRAADPCLGTLPLLSIAERNLIFQTVQSDGVVREEQRLSQPDETIVLGAMQEMLIGRKLCMVADKLLVFPSYKGIPKASPAPDRHLISYTFSGYLDDIYATLVVKLAYCGYFKLKAFWRDAADFTGSSGHAMGVRLHREVDGKGTILIHFGKGVPRDIQVAFANYIQDHLLEKASNPRRRRLYVCDACGTPVMNTEEAARRLAEDREAASILCVRCEQRIQLWDELEAAFASDTARAQVVDLQKKVRAELDSRRMGKLLALEVEARFASAMQSCHQIPQDIDEGIDMEVEFTDDHGNGTGRHVFLQLKCGNSHLAQRRYGRVFRIKEQRWVSYWANQDCPVLLVIGTLVDPPVPGVEGSERFAEIEWMEIRDLLRRELASGKAKVNQIVFEGQRLDATTVRRLRDQMLGVVRTSGVGSMTGKAARRI